MFSLGLPGYFQSQISLVLAQAKTNFNDLEQRVRRRGYLSKDEAFEAFVHDFNSSQMQKYIR